MITRNCFLDAVQENVNRIHAYELGQDGRNGACDCIGLIIGAVRLAGGSWPGVHGSNWAARNAIRFGESHPASQCVPYIYDASDCFLGEIVFKAKEPGDAGYDLPSSYDSSRDRRDYYHVGVVTSVSPLCITHCTSVDGGIKRDNALGKWRWGGKLKYVDYEKGGNEMDNYMHKAKVYAENGYPVKMRQAPDTQAAVITKVDVGEIVEVMGEIGTEETGMWGFIRRDNGQTGYMMAKFLIPENAETGGEKADFPVTLTAEEFNGILEALEGAVEMLKKAREEYEQV